MIRESEAEVRILPDDQERPGTFARLTRSGWFMAVASPAWKSMPVRSSSGRRSMPRVSGAAS